eukprot:2231216-Prorocentrum_lima.AAC.1
MQRTTERATAALHSGACSGSGASIYAATWASLWLHHLNVWLTERAATRRWLPTGGTEWELLRLAPH